MRFSAYIALVATAAFMSSGAEAITVTASSAGKDSTSAPPAKNNVTNNVSEAFSGGVGGVIEKTQDELTKDMKAALSSIPYMDEILKYGVLAKQAAELAKIALKKASSAETKNDWMATFNTAIGGQLDAWKQQMSE